MPWRLNLQARDGAGGNAWNRIVLDGRGWGQPNFYGVFRKVGLYDGVLGLLSEQKTDEAQALFDRVAGDPDAPDSIKKLMQAVVTILNGSRDTALANDLALDFNDAAEVLFLIERLGGWACGGSKAGGVDWLGAGLLAAISGGGRFPMISWSAFGYHRGKRMAFYSDGRPGANRVWRDIDKPCRLWFQDASRYPKAKRFR